MYFYYNTIQVPIQPLLDQHLLSLVPVQVLVQPHRYRVLLLVSLKTLCSSVHTHAIIVSSSCTAMFCVLFAGSSGSQPLATDDGRPAEDAGQ